MSRALALLRPEPGWSVSAKAASQAGLEVVGHTLFEALPLEWQVPEGRFDALLAGSAAAFHCGGAMLAQVTDLPVYAVGASTAKAAREAGFLVAEVGSSGLQALLDRTGRNLRFLRLAGEERIALRLHPGQTMVERTVYRMVPLPITSPFVAALHDRPLIALHSAAAASHFAAEIDRLGIARASLAVLAIGPRVLAAAGSGWSGAHITTAPDEAAMLAKALALCN